MRRILALGFSAVGLAATLPAIAADLGSLPVKAPVAAPAVVPAWAGDRRRILPC